MASATEILARLDRGEDPALDKIVTKRADELGISRLQVLRLMLEEG